MLTNCVAACAHDRFWDRARYWSKIVIFSYPLAFDAPVRGVSVGVAPPPFGVEKLEWLGYPMVKKFRIYLYSFWRNSRTWQTDRWTDKQTLYAGNSRAMHSIARQKFVSLPSEISLKIAARTDVLVCSFKVDVFFWPCDAMHSAAIAVTRCPSVRLSVCLSRSGVAPKRIDIFEIFSPSGSDTILVFPYQRGRRYSNGNAPNRGVECKGVECHPSIQHLGWFQLFCPVSVSINY